MYTRKLETELLRAEWDYRHDPGCEVLGLHFHDSEIAADGSVVLSRRDAESLASALGVLLSGEPGAHDAYPRKGGRGGT